MSMPQDLMQMLLGGGGGQSSFQPGQGMLAPSVPVSVTPPEPRMGPEEQAAMAMFSPPKDDLELQETANGWKGWLENSKKKPAFFQAMAQFGAAMARPGGFAKNFTEAAAIYQNTLAQGERDAEEKGIQKFGILQQARAMDKQAGMQQEQLKLQKGDQKLAQDRYGLQVIESQENRQLAQEGMGLKRRELALAEAQSKNTKQRDDLQNSLLEMQIRKMEKDIDGTGLYEILPSDPPGQIYFKEAMNAKLRADPKTDKAKATVEVMKAYNSEIATLVIPPGMSPLEALKEKTKLMVSLVNAAPLLPGQTLNPQQIAQDAETMLASGSTPSSPDNSVEEKARAAAIAQGYTVHSIDVKTKTMVVEKNGKKQTAGFK